MLYLGGIIVFIGAIASAVAHLDQQFASYYDYVGCSLVLGGTLAAALMTLPFEMKTELYRRTIELFTRTKLNRNKFIHECLTMNKNIQMGVYNVPSTKNGLAYSILKDGVELIQLGFHADKIETILKERLYQSTERVRYLGNAIRGLSKYPPAFGLIGTVLGLVHLMRGVSGGMSSQETGLRMAIALVATFYGLLVANILVNPLGDAIFKNSYDDEKTGEIALQAVLLAAEKADMLEAQELLNSYVEPHERVDLVGTTDNAEFEGNNAPVDGEGVTAA